MLRGSLRQLGNADALLAAANIEPEKRPEQLEPEEFFRLASCWRDGAAN
jgi:16S rRNA A1518/A1519 N6-dimethyltransferase RsmA/KsgA/DIM1 with predicted DNA glycosylase/AP lyase activity